MTAPRIVVFDLDGTLIDSAPDIAAAANVMLREIGREALPLPRIVAFVGSGVPKLVERCLDATGGRDEAGFRAALAIFRRAYDADPATLTRPYPGVPEMLEALAGAGFALGVCTNKPEAPARAILEALGLAGRFGAVVGGDTLPVTKPDPAPLREAVSRLGGGAALFVGDSETDEATAKAAGLPFLFFTGGYRKKPAEAFAADFAFDRFEALAAHLAAKRG